MENPNAGINIALTSSDVVSYKAYTVTDTSEEELTSDDITIGEDYFSGKKVLNVWLGSGSSLPISSKPILLVITGEDGSKQILFIINK